MHKTVYKSRFEIFLLTQLAILFGSLLFPLDFFEVNILPILYLCNIGAGLIMLLKTKRMLWFVVFLFLVATSVFGYDMIYRSQNLEHLPLRIAVYFVFQIILAREVILQVWRAKQVTKNVIMGLISGYISLGFLAFFIFILIEISHSNSFLGIGLDSGDIISKSESLLYFAYITLLTVGYGDIIPVTPIAQKAVILVGLMGQFYMVIITAVVVEKYIRHSKK